MDSLHRESPFANPCPDEECSVCSDAEARALAAHLGLADDPDAGRYDVSMVDLSAFADPATDPTIEADARAADSIRWGLWSPVLPRTYCDEDNPGEAEPWGPDDPDDAARLELFPWATEGGVGIDELSPEEQENELWGESEWVSACKEHAQWMEEQEQEAAYHDMIRRLTMGGHPSDW